MQEPNLSSTVPALNGTPAPLPENKGGELNNKFIVILLFILLFISISFTIFFAYKTQTLNKELITVKNTYLAEKNYENSENLTDAINNPTNWEVYTNYESGYSIMFPKNEYTRLNCVGEELTAVKYSDANEFSSSTLINCERDGRYDFEIKSYPSVETEPGQTIYYDVVISDIQIGGISGKMYIHTFTHIEEGPYPEWFAVAQVNKDGKTYEIYFGDKDNLNLFYQILSTFKFI